MNSTSSFDTCDGCEDFRVRTGGYQRP
jgi:hypothetical protein